MRKTSLNPKLGTNAHSNPRERRKRRFGHEAGEITLPFPTPNKKQNKQKHITYIFMAQISLVSSFNGISIFMVPIGFE